METIAKNVYHSGIKGQKWGIRRYQNPDGSLTDEGRKRYARNGVFSENEKSKLKKGAAIGAGIGAVGAAASIGATVAIGLASGGALAVPASELAIKGAAAVVAYAANGAIKGATVGSLIGGYQTQKAQKYLTSNKSTYNKVKVRDLNG